MSSFFSLEGMLTICCCIGAGSCGEENCPELCLCCEAHVCNFAAISATRAYVQMKYDLTVDPCDNQLIRCNNIIQCIACVCHILAMIDGSFSDCAQICDLIADIVYHTVSGCMTGEFIYTLF